MLAWLCLVLCWLAQVNSVTVKPTAQPTAKPTVPPTAPTAPPTPAPRNFELPRLPISKENATYPDCRAEIIFVLDVSGSVQPDNQQTMLRFVVKFMIAIEENIQDARFGVVIFGIRSLGQTTSQKHFDSTEWGGGVLNMPPPYGNNLLNGATELLLGLDHLRYNCTGCEVINQSWSQLEVMYTLSYGGDNTPTWDGMNYSKTEYQSKGDPSVPGRFVILITDGVPNNGGSNGGCVAPGYNPIDCGISLNKTAVAVNETKIGTLLLTVGMNLDAFSQPFMISWASDPKDVLAVPSTDYSQLANLIPKILAVMCPKGGGVDCLSEDATSLDISGAGFLNTGSIFCRFFRDGEDPTPAHTTRGIFVNSTMITCPLPAPDDWFPGTWNLNYTRDGRGYYEGARFKTGTLCRPQLLVIWWPFCALALLPLAFCRPKKVAPVTTQKVSRGVARAAPAATEEYEEYEEVEEIVAPPEPVNKWKVAPTAYIGFGRARMSVDWAGVAPESAPHEGVRKKVVKKVVSDHAPVPTAGPAFVPSPVEEAPQETVTHSRPQTVEEPDWVNSFMDRIAAIFCCCCVNKKK